MSSSIWKVKLSIACFLWMLTPNSTAPTALHLFIGMSIMKKKIASSIVSSTCRSVPFSDLGCWLLNLVGWRELPLELVKVLSGCSSHTFENKKGGYNRQSQPRKWKTGREKVNRQGQEDDYFICNSPCEYWRSLTRFQCELKPRRPLEFSTNLGLLVVERAHLILVDKHTPPGMKEGCPRADYTSQLKCLRLGDFYLVDC